MASISDQLKENPAAKELLANQKAIRQLLADPETRKVLSSLQQELSSDPQAAQAMQKLDKNLHGT